MTLFISVYQHDSEVNEAMLKAWKDIFGINIQIDMTKREDDGDWMDGFPNIFDAIIEDHKEHLKWSERSIDWEAKKPSILKEVAKY